MKFQKKEVKRSCGSIPGFYEPEVEAPEMAMVAWVAFIAFAVSILVSV